MSSPCASPQKALDNSAIDVETLDEDIYELLDDATDLGTLEYELSEVKRNLSLRKNNGQYVPLLLFRNLSMSVAVSAISNSLWCEQQMEYQQLHPHMVKTAEWGKRSVKGRPIERETKQMIQGTAIHTKKELEIRDIVKIDTVTKEDRCAVELIDTFVKLRSVQSGGLEREIKVLGCPFGQKIMLSGVVDQLQYCRSDGTLVLLELKTRRSKSLPESEQKRSNHLQVMIYKTLLDSLTQGHCKYIELLQQKDLRLAIPLSHGPTEYLKESGLSHLITNEHQIITLGQLAHSISELIKGLDLPSVESLLIQYEYQGNGEVLGVEPVIYDEDWACKEVISSLKYWKGEREAVGVDIEESWKCETCQFKEVCVWRRRQKMETSPVKKWPSEFFSSPPKKLAF